MATRCIKKDCMSEDDKILIQKIDEDNQHLREANKENKEKRDQKRKLKKDKEAQFEQLCKNVDRIIDMQGQQNEILMSLVCQLASGSRVEIPRSLVRNVYMQYTESAS